MIRLIALGLIIVLFGLSARITERNWTAPAVFFNLLWGSYVLSATYFIVDQQQLVSGVFWIALGCGAVLVGTLVGHIAPRPEPQPRADKFAASDFPFLRSVSIVAAGIGIVQILFMFARQGFSLRSVISYAAIGQLAAMNRGEFIYGDQQQTVGEQIGFLCLYFGALTGGLLFKVGGNRIERILGILNVLLPATVLSLYGSRMGLLFGASFWVSSYISARVLEQGLSSDGRFFFRAAGLAVVMLVGLQVLIQVVRYSTQRDPVPLFRMIADPFGFLAAFGIWFDHAGWQFSGFTAGARTFRRIAGLIGISAPLLPEIPVGFTSSNIYTVFRDLIEDFGSIGALLVLFLYGYCVRLLHARVRAGDARYLGLLTLAFAVALTSFSVSIFFYTATSLAAIAFVLYCLICVRKGPSRSVPSPERLGRRPADVWRLGPSEL